MTEYGSRPSNIARSQSLSPYKLCTSDSNSAVDAAEVMVAVLFLEKLLQGVEFCQVMARVV